MAANVASSSSTGERSPARNASTNEHASPCQGVSVMSPSSRGGRCGLQCAAILADFTGDADSTAFRGHVSSATEMAGEGRCHRGGGSGPLAQAPEVAAILMTAAQVTGDFSGPRPGADGDRPNRSRRRQRPLRAEQDPASAAGAPSETDLRNEGGWATRVEPDALRAAEMAARFRARSAQLEAQRELERLRHRHWSGERLIEEGRAEIQWWEHAEADPYAVLGLLPGHPSRRPALPGARSLGPAIPTGWPTTPTRISRCAGWWPPTPPTTGCAGRSTPSDRRVRGGTARSATGLRMT